MPISTEPLADDQYDLYILDQMLHRIQLCERKLSQKYAEQDYDAGLVNLLSIANELSTIQILKASQYHKLFDKVSSIMAEHLLNNSRKIPEVFLGSIKLLCPRVLLKLHRKSDHTDCDEIKAIYSPLKAVFFNVLAFQQINCKSFLIEALVFSTRDDDNREYFVKYLSPLILQSLPIEEIFDCLIHRSNYRAQEYYL